MGSSVEIVENAAVSPVDGNLMVDNMSNIKETEFLVETSTNLASSQEPSEIFSQSDEHMAQKVSEFGVNGEYENSKDIDETNNCLEDNARKDTSVEILNPVEIEPLISDNGIPVNDPKEIYENTTFELNSVEKDSVFDQQKIHEDAEYQPNVGDMISGSQHVDNDSETPKFDKDTYNELVIENSVEPSNKTTEEDIIKETECLDTKTSKPEIENLEQVKVNELESQSENNASDGYESSAQAENKEFIEDLEKRAEDELTTQIKPKIETITNVQPIFVEEFKKETLEIENHQTEGVNLLVEAENDSLLDKSNIMESVSDQQSTVTELPMENENVTEKVSEIDLQTGIQDSEPAIELETTKEPQVETHLTSQELNANTAQQNIETTEEVKTETAESTVEPRIISVPVVVPVEETKKVSETKTESAPIKKATSKPAPKTANATKTPAGSATSANASKPGTTTKPQTNGAARPTSASTRPTTRPASARPTTTPSATKTPTSRPQTAKTSSAPAKTPSSRPAPLTRPSPLPSTLKPRTTSTSRLRAASATRKAQASSTNGTSKAPVPASARTSRTPLSRPSPRSATSSTATEKAQTKPTTTPARPTPSKTTPARPTPSRPTPGTKKPLPGSKAPVTKGSNKPVAIKKPSADIADIEKSEVSVEENMLNQHEENKVNGLSNGVHPIPNGVNGVHSDDEGQSLKLNGCNGALDSTEPVQ